MTVLFTLKLQEKSSSNIIDAHIILHFTDIHTQKHSLSHSLFHKRYANYTFKQTIF